jgi:hypothetical protein
LFAEKSGALEKEGMGIVALKSGAELKDGTFINACFKIDMNLMLFHCI